MNNSQKIQVVTHTDLDGVCSYLALSWLYGRKLDVVGTTPKRLQQDYEKLISNGTDWNKIYFLDLDVSAIGEIIDQTNTVIIDHHKTNIYQFKHAVTCILNETSCAKLILNNFIKKINTKITPAQKTLIALADDWDSNKRITPLSTELNIVYHSLSNKFSSFVDDYYHGFVPFDKFKINTIQLYKKHCSEYINQINPFFGNIEFDGIKDVKVGAVFCDKFVQECCDFLFSKYSVDVAIAVMVEQKRIAVRRSNLNTNIDVSKFVQRIASGGGHEAAAGGNLTDEFIEFTKLLRQS